mgnify:CR=1 FL=1
MAANEDRSVDSRQNDKLTLRLTPETRAAMEWMSAKYGGISMAEVIRKALSTEKFLLEEREKGVALLLEARDGRTRELVLR